MDPKVAGMMGIPPYTSIVAGFRGAGTTDLDRYVRAEFGDRDAAWFADGVRPNHSEGTPSKPGNDGRLLRRLTQAITTFLF